MCLHKEMLFNFLETDEVCWEVVKVWLWQMFLCSQAAETDCQFVPKIKAFFCFDFTQGRFEMQSRHYIKSRLQFLAGTTGDSIGFPPVVIGLPGHSSIASAWLKTTVTMSTEISITHLRLAPIFFPLALTPQPLLIESYCNLIGVAWDLCCTSRRNRFSPRLGNEETNSTDAALGSFGLLHTSVLFRYNWIPVFCHTQNKSQNYIFLGTSISYCMSWLSFPWLFLTAVNEALLV